MTRPREVNLFTIEGTMHSVFAIILGTLYGMPVLLYVNRTGISMSQFEGDFGLGKAIFLVFDPKIILLTIIFIILASAVASYFPARKIAKMNPVLALKGKLQ